MLSPAVDLNRPNTSEVYSGVFFDLDNPRAEQVDIKDIAHHLSMMCRFAGGCSKFLSVAEHSIRVATVVQAAGCSTELVFAALMHDAHETYTNDIPTSVKRMMVPMYHKLVTALDLAICVKFDIAFADMRSREVKLADNLMLAIEAHWLMKSGGDGPHWNFLEKPTPDQLAVLKPACMSPADAKEAFVLWFNRLQAKMMKNARDGGQSYTPTYIG